MSEEREMQIQYYEEVAMELQKHEGKKTKLFALIRLQHKLERLVM